jgi:hypothetical protein
MPKYSFNISSTAKNKVAPTTLFNEIENSVSESDFSVSVLVDKINIFTELAWSESKQVLLSATIYNHKGEDTRKRFRVASLVDASLGSINPYIAPKGIDFTSDLAITLNKKKYPLVGGRPTKVEYYVNFDSATNTYSDLVCQIAFSFEFDSLGLIERKYEWLKYAYEDETISSDEEDWKDLGKKFNPIRDAAYKDQEDILARQNQYSQLRVNVAGMIAKTMGISIPEALQIGITYLTQRGNFFKSWVEDAVRTPLIAVLEADKLLPENAWLNNPIDVNGTTILLYILSEVNYRTL